ncbi:hypothetical protein M430DRAFT_23342 [Amorphotheca resinae ATCC 22711]|uniref:Short-chain dehydrogenase n=1 Tax=Amorphotheca resinae ATCC 22711 TaxID=857342 RepID=A0A2T3AQE6_AMORE|nr:hypothetical protein M430DRAFT_23342 [Amorphotheca resinae ATCC 22711]PSS07194.1 hypothetical protein M430DRAFT_23342 [Amorphotheca resinae ATCC 22711]
MSASTILNSNGFNQHTDGLEVASRFKDLIVGKTVLITGAGEGGLGAEAAFSIASASPALLILHGRAEERVKPVVERITAAFPSVKTRIFLMDLDSLASVRKAAAEVASWEDVAIDVLINNAAVMAAPYSTTKDGFESQFGVGHLGHFLFTCLLLKANKIKSGGRIVNVSSGGHRLGPVRFDDPGFTNGTKYEKWAAYGQVKTANMLFSIALAERLKDRNILSFSLHPGGIHTNLLRHLSQEDLENLIKSLREREPDYEFKTLQQGVSTHLVAAFDPSIAKHNGAYLSDCQIAQPLRPDAGDPEEARKLWTLSEELVGEKF